MESHVKGIGESKMDYLEIRGKVKAYIDKLSDAQLKSAIDYIEFLLSKEEKEDSFDTETWDKLSDEAFLSFEENCL